ncbi:MULTISPECIES: hypothetical protein [Croceitalea]|uniref:Leucine-rich repeat domain-containing protein n=1 Tax=Croceitalea vernalis TaxID=3075599 RepID=A0ABU3BFW0_9FLAO|nr:MULTISPECIES: hypothetical protein [unclassified Croceitalea]MDT0539253.1 hypothetical protein [Croceitalea sp. P059]MDT0621047.1 hypothetical protein [Croceitalea sp. P007]
MKKINFYYLFCFLFLVSCSTDSIDSESIDEETNEEILQQATTAIADAAFEQALIDLNFDEELDGQVLNSRIQIIQNLILDENEISDLTGIAGFRDLENLSVRNNNLTTIDVSLNKKLKFLWCEDNAVSEIDLEGLTILEKVGADRNALSTITVTDNTALQLLTLSDNDLSSIDVSTNNALTDFSITMNPLDCIRVNQNQLDNIPTDWSKDEMDTYALDCQ